MRVPVAGGLGPPHVWQYTRVLLLRPESHHLKEENGTLEKTHEHTGHDSSGTAERAGTGRVGGSIYSLGGKVLKPEANTKQTRRAKTRRLVGWFFPVRFIHFKYWSLF